MEKSQHFFISGTVFWLFARKSSLEMKISACFFISRQALAESAFREAYLKGSLLLQVRHKRDPHRFSLVDTARVSGAHRINAGNDTKGVEKLRAADQKVERCFRGIVAGLDDDKLGSRRKECPGSSRDIFFPRRDEKDYCRVFQVIGSEYETSVAIVSLIIDSCLCKSAFDQLAFQIVSYRTPPASLQENIVPDVL